MSSFDMSPPGGFEDTLADLDFDGAFPLWPTRRRAGRGKGSGSASERPGRRPATGPRSWRPASSPWPAPDHYEGLLALAADPVNRTPAGGASRGASAGGQAAPRRGGAPTATVPGRRRTAYEGGRRGAGALRHLQARSELGKVDPRWLTEQQREDLSDLKIQTDRATAERRDLENRTAAVLREHMPEPPRPLPRTDQALRMKPKGCLVRRWSFGRLSRRPPPCSLPDGGVTV